MRIHGKLQLEQENLENLLTSNVFGALKHVPVSQGLLPFLRRATGKDASKLIAALASDVADVGYEFWPRLASCEPDVLIRLTPVGTLMQVSPQGEWAEDYDANSYPFERACSFGVPLIDITSAALLQERVLKPLLASVRGSHALLHGLANS